MGQNSSTTKRGKHCKSCVSEVTVEAPMQVPARCPTRLSEILDPTDIACAEFEAAMRVAARSQLSPYALSLSSTHLPARSPAYIRHNTSTHSLTPLPAPLVFPPTDTSSTRSSLSSPLLPLPATYQPRPSPLQPRPSTSHSTTSRIFTPVNCHSGFMVKSPSGHLLDAKAYKEHPERPLTVRERQEKIRAGVCGAMKCAATGKCAGEGKMVKEKKEGRKGQEKKKKRGCWGR